MRGYSLCGKGELDQALELLGAMAIRMLPENAVTGGIPDAPLQVIGPSERSGTTLSFTLEESFCEGASLSLPAFKDWLATLDSSIPVEAVRILEG